MTQQQRASVWQRKDQLKAGLKQTASANAQQQIREQIDACNQSLISDVFSLPEEPVEPQAV